ncbi:MAG: hypothetical protein C4576_12380 [Desulfobacteraceae bacterium]|nr:MAG: hypothetical protein C4576_12380 [Desulfobacteraceae bacterium]
MDANDYLRKVLASQTLQDDSEELKALQSRRAEVEQLLRDHFDDSSPTIRYGGSKAKGTMIKEAYDLDVVCYFPHDDNGAGETLEDIYRNVQKACEQKYLVEPKASALRLKSTDSSAQITDFHIDVVPGRFTDDSKTDAFLYRSSGEKKRLKTNLDLHIEHVKESGVTDAIRLFKLWKVRNALGIRNFVLELLVIKLLTGKSRSNLAGQLEHIWKEFRDNVENLSVEDPANPSGNDLSELLSGTVRSELSSVAERTLSLIRDSGWESVFGPTEEKSGQDKRESLIRAAKAVVTPTKPWSREI